MYDGIKKYIGPVQRMTSSLKSSTGEILTENNEQMERWVEHYSNLYYRQNTVSQNALDFLECLQIMDELESVPIIKEFSSDIDNYSKANHQDLITT